MLCADSGRLPQNVKEELVMAGFELKEYLLQLLTTNLITEYQDQIEAWKLYIEDVVDAANSASDKVKDTLVDANAELQAAREQAYGIAMLLLSMVAGPAISWLGAMVKLNWAPKITSVERIEMQTKEIWTMNSLGKQYQVFISQPVSIKVKNDVVNQILGDVTKSATGFVFGLGQTALKPKGQTAPDLKTNFSTLSWESFRTGLLRSLYDAQGAAKSQIMDLANTVREDVGFGDKILARLFREQPNLEKRPAKEQEQAGMRMIAKMLNDLRNGWAGTDRWFYFGNDPPRLNPDLNINYEREIWAQWIRGQNIKLDSRLAGGSKYSYDVRYVVKSDSGFFMTKAVQGELRQMAMPHLFDMSTWDSELNAALLGVEDVDDEQVDDAITDRQKAEYDAQRKTAEAAVRRMLKWAENFRPVGPLDYGTPRQIPLEPIEWYKGRYPSYKSA
jgi:hypothetical protein